MGQLSFTDAEFANKKRKTRREKFLEERETAVPWEALEALIEPYYPKVGNGRHPDPLSTMLRIHVMQHWYDMSDPGMEDALYEIQPMRLFAGLSLTGPIPDETTILKKALKKPSMAFFREWNRKMRFSIPFIFNRLHRLKRAVHPCTAQEPLFLRGSLA